MPPFAATSGKTEPIGFVNLLDERRPALPGLLVGSPANLAAECSGRVPLGGELKQLFKFRTRVAPAWSVEHGGWRLNRNKWDAAQRVPTIGLTIRFEHAFGHPPTAGPGRFSIRFKPAQEAGKRRWYADYQLRVAKVERAYAKTGRAQGQSVEFEIRLDDLSGPEIAGLLAEHLRCMAEVSPPAAASRTFQRGAVAN